MILKDLVTAVGIMKIGDESDDVQMTSMGSDILGNLADFMC